MAGKIIIISAPSGCGKSTIINALMAGGEIDMQFSVSATNRPPRPGEKHGVNYYFISDREFRERIAANAFVEYEEVYKGRFYGTLRSEVDRITDAGHNVVLDIDVKGGCNVKKQFGDNALSIFIKPPSVQALRHRLENRATDSPEMINERVSKADFELTFAPLYDVVIVNDDLQRAVAQAADAIQQFLSR